MNDGLSDLSPEKIVTFGGLTPKKDFADQLVHGFEGLDFFGRGNFSSILAAFSKSASTERGSESASALYLSYSDSALS
jgi:hypothetical protein